MTVTPASGNERSEQTDTRCIEPDWGESFVADLVFNAAQFERSFPDVLNERERWMGALPGSKKPYAPWSNPDDPAPCNKDECPVDTAADPACTHDARYKWGWEGHYLTGREVDQAALTSEIANRAYIFSEDDEFIFVDFDDVRCPETGAVHPVAVAFLALMGPTWVEVSSSGTGIHAVYIGGLPGDIPQATPIIDDEPWGSITPSSDDDERDVLPKIELYSTKRKVGVLTGKTVPGAPVTVKECNEDVLEAFLEAHSEIQNTSQSQGSDRRDRTGVSDERGKNGDVLGWDDVTDDIEDVYASIDALDVRRVADKTIVETWTDENSGPGIKSFLPTWGSSNDRGHANYVTDDPDGFWTDEGTGAWGREVEMAAVACSEITVNRRSIQQGDVDGGDFITAVKHLRGTCDCTHNSCEFPIPYYAEGGDTAQLYLDVLDEYAEAGEDPYSNPVDCLMVSLRVDEDDAVPGGADPPELAVNALVKAIWGYEPGSDMVDEENREFARELFGELDPETARDEFDLTTGSDGNGG